jgi:NADPH-dependent 7-cyano-7-deazaguanine reductase QueF
MADKLQDQLEELKAARNALKVIHKEVPQPELLIPLRNEWPACARETIQFLDFKAVSPVSDKYPISGTITVVWIPKDVMFDSKSLQAYIDSFKTVPLFYYEIPPLIAYTLFGLAAPKSVYVKGEFTVDGNFSVCVETYLPLDSKGGIYKPLQSD